MEPSLRILRSFNPLICIRAQELARSQTSPKSEGALQGYSSVGGEGERARSRRWFSLGWRRSAQHLTTPGPTGEETWTEVKRSCCCDSRCFPRNRPVISPRRKANAHTHNTGLCIKTLAGGMKRFKHHCASADVWLQQSERKWMIWLSPNVRVGRMVEVLFSRRHQLRPGHDQDWKVLRSRRGQNIWSSRSRPRQRNICQRNDNKNKKQITKKACF